ncbi:FadR/GntR family transcriptional regulator [Nocardioides sp. GXZ039]|uniref:FadR/GntR family transcriptional regulator n=1 Tax=Nocardioides sp. GXZ039 TaxID=3136018 RepID=UPI0030F3A369
MTHDDILLAPLHTPPAYAAVVDRVRRALALGVLLPGDRLPSERTLAEELGVSRVTVREALRVLQGEGLLVTKRGSGGTVVSTPAREVGRVSETLVSEVAEVFEFRVAVESMAARLAAERSAGDVAKLLDCQDALASSTDVDAFRRADSEFHLSVAHMSANAMLRRSIEDARAAAFSWLDLREFTVFHDSSIRGHAAIIEAISRGDGEAAAAAMVDHISTARGEVLAALRAA